MRYIFEITDKEYWRVDRGYSKNEGTTLDINKLQEHLRWAVKNKQLLVSGNRLIDFGQEDNCNLSMMIATNNFRLKGDFAEMVGNTDPTRRLRGKLIPGISVRSTTGVLPYRSRI